MNPLIIPSRISAPDISGNLIYCTDTFNHAMRCYNMWCTNPGCPYIKTVFYHHWSNKIVKTPHPINSCNMCQIFDIYISQHNANCKNIACSLKFCKHYIQSRLNLIPSSRDNLQRRENMDSVVISSIKLTPDLVEEENNDSDSSDEVDNSDDSDYIPNDAGSNSDSEDGADSADDSDVSDASDDSDASDESDVLDASDASDVSDASDGADSADDSVEVSPLKRRRRL